MPTPPAHPPRPAAALLAQRARNGARLAVLLLAASVGSASAQTVTFGEGCPAGNEVRLSIDTPIAAAPFTIEIQTPSASAPTALFVGASGTDWLGTPLPIDLRLIGAPGCLLNVAPMITLALTTDPEGCATVVAALPQAGVAAYLQAISILPGAHGPLAVSRGERVTAAGSSEPFRIVMLPDTQGYTIDESRMTHFRAQTRWIRDNIDKEDLAFVSHVGDVVEHGAQGANNNGAEWARAISAIVTFEAGSQQNPDGPIPFAVQIGNRDYDTIDDKQTSATFAANFPPIRLAGRSWWGGSLDASNTYQIFPAQGKPILHLGIEWRPDDAALDWAQEVLRRHPSLPVILTTHEYLDRGWPGPLRETGENFDGGGANSGYGIYHKLVEPNPQIFLVLCGHMFGNGRRTTKTQLGTTVHQILSNFQGDPEGGNGWMSLLTLRPDDSEMDFRTFSPTYQAGISDGPDRSQEATANFTLPLDLPSHRAQIESMRVLHFRDGLPTDSGTYAGTRDTHIGDGTIGVTQPWQSYGTDDTLRIDADEDAEQALLRFDDLFGDGPDQIPQGSRIRSALLTLTTEGFDAPSGTGARLHRMLVPWSETDSWNDLGGGVQLGNEALTEPDADPRGKIGRYGAMSVDVTASVQAWSDGEANYGWLLQASGEDLWCTRSSEWPYKAERPMLTVVLEKAP